MGIYDTFKFDRPIYCSFCGTGHMLAQSKGFEPDLLTFNPGDVVCTGNPEGEEFNQIREEDLLCFAKEHDAGQPLPDSYPRPSREMAKVYLVVKDGKYLGARPDRESAENLLGLGDYYFNQG